MILTLTLFGPVELIGSTYLAGLEAARERPDLPSLVWRDIQLAAWLSVGVQILVMMSIGLTLLRPFRRTAVYFSIVMIWLVGPVWNVITSIVFRVAVGASVPPDVPSTLLAFLFSSVCTAYLLRSKRVRSTYPDAPTDLLTIATRFE